MRGETVRVDSPPGPADVRPGSSAPEGLPAPPAAVCSIDAAARLVGAGLRTGVDGQVPLGAGLG